MSVRCEPSRVARAPPQSPAVVALALLRRTAGARLRQGLRGHRRRRQGLPRLLRRHPDHDDRPLRCRRWWRRSANRPAGSCTLRRSTSSAPWSSWPRRSPPCRPSPTPRSSSSAPGTEATEAALLLCCGARRSNQVLALRNSYHGRSFTAMSVTGNRCWSASSLSPLQVSYLHNGDRRRGPFAGLDDRSSTPPAPPTCARSSRRPPPGTSPA